MLLGIDIGNTSTSFGLFEGEKLVKRWNIKTTALRNANLAKYAKIDVMVASVVPNIDKHIKAKLPKAKFITAKSINGLTIKIIGDVGADRAVNAYAVRMLYGTPAIVVDFGTATTFDVVSRNGEYLGGAIVPGIRMAADVLNEKTAKLPKISIKNPKKLIGNSTVEAMRSGIFYGYVSLVEGMIKRMKIEIRKSKLDIRVIATGGYAKFIGKYAHGIDIIDQDLTLKGLNMLCQKN